MCLGSSLSVYGFGFVERQITDDQSLLDGADWRCLVVIKMRWIEKERHGVGVVVGKYLDIELEEKKTGSRVRVRPVSSGSDLQI